MRRDAKVGQDWKSLTNSASSFPTGGPAPTTLWFALASPLFHGILLRNHLKGTNSRGESTCSDWCHVVGRLEKPLAGIRDETEGHRGQTEEELGPQ